MTMPNHAMYDDLLTKMEREAGVSKNVLARVFVRLIISAPADVARADIAKGTMLAKPSALNQSAVSKAVACLVNNGLVSEDPIRSDPEERGGRPIVPLRLGSPLWALMGIKIVHDEDKPVMLHGVVTDMRVDRAPMYLARARKRLDPHVTFETVAEEIKCLHDELVAKLESPRQLFGIGVEVASHVHDGEVIGATHVGLSKDDKFDLLTPLQKLLGVPIVIDNDVNVLAVRETYRPKAERHVAVVAVLNDGVGGSLIIDGHVYRGGGGMAAEPGHHTVAAVPMPPVADHPDDDQRRFVDPCHCGRPNHVDCFSVPRRLEVELGTSIAIAGREPIHGHSGQLTRAAQVFRTGGEALGQGIASMINTVNPSRVILILPGDLARADLSTTHISRPQPRADDDGVYVGRAEPATAATEYLEGVESALTAYSFSTGALNARAGRRYLTVRVMDTDEIEEQGAVCAAIRVLDAFVMHARERDRCHELEADGTTPPARQGEDSSELDRRTRMPLVASS